MSQKCFILLLITANIVIFGLLLAFVDREGAPEVSILPTAAVLPTIVRQPDIAPTDEPDALSMTNSEAISAKADAFQDAALADMPALDVSAVPADELAAPTAMNLPIVPQPTALEPVFMPPAPVDLVDPAQAMSPLQAEALPVSPGVGASSANGELVSAQADVPKILLEPTLAPVSYNGEGDVTAQEIFLTVRLVVERVHELSNLDSGIGPDADFYAQLCVDGDCITTGVIEGENDISPNWTHSKVVPFSKGSVPVRLVIKEEDGTIFNGPDDAVDITPGDDYPLDVVVQFGPCQIVGDLTGPCGVPIITAGTDSDRAEARFRIEVIEPPPVVAGLYIRCAHAPLWPQAGQQVTITAEVLDGELNQTVLADSIEIWSNSQTGPAISTNGATTLTFSYTPSPGTTQIAYGCYATDLGNTGWSGWRTVQIGQPATGRAVPVIFNGDSSTKLDIVFVPDIDSYTGGNDPDFLEDVTDVILGAYYGDILFLVNQKRFNFWIAQDTGDVDGTLLDLCTLFQTPMNWNTDYAFADAGAILHTNTFRDCADRSLRSFSSEPGSFSTIRHEMGHQPFGLADEYSGDGGYFEAAPYPNLYDTLAECQSDAVNVGKSAGDCRTFTSVDDDGKITGVWFTSDPSATDLMVDNDVPRELDIRRFNWMFDRCNVGQC